MRQNSHATIQIGVKEYLVDLKKIPYFDAFLGFQQRAGQPPVHEDVPFFDIINSSVEQGYRQIFRLMPTQLSDYRILCETFEYLAIDVLKNRKLCDIVKDTKLGRDEWDPDEKRTIKGLKSVPRDAAFQLLYLFMLGEFELDAKDSNIAYNAVQYIVSHRRIFRCRTRKIIREVFENRFDISEKQRSGLNKWPISEPGSDEWQVEDATTEEDDYDSDYSDW
ncbi:hypothetical protein N0V90_007790 [Kalmusia sp. IMI 367209]|nr:hypothetical protein N0V90_007790 [Kalmusia sp. IMI 367209]